MRTIENGYYDFDFDIDICLKGGMIEDMFYLKDLKQRKLFVNMDITQESVEDSVRHIMQINAEDRDIPVEERKPILLYITSNGGDVGAGFELVDAIIASKTPVYTINLGFWYSMGFLIGLAGTKRFATPNAKFLVHDGSNFVYNSGAKAQDQAEFNRRVEGRIKDYILSRSTLTSEEYDDKFRVEWYLFADEAKEKGFVDCIVGTDCSIDDII